MRRFLLLSFLLFGLGCGTNAENKPVVLMSGNPKQGDVVYHEGKWWKIVKVSSNSEPSNIFSGRTLASRYCELERIEEGLAK